MINSIIGLSTSLKGEFDVKGNLRIDGYFEGKITGNSSILIGHTGSANFELEAKDIIVGGHISGDMKIQGKVLVLSTGSIKGKIEAKSIEIEPGGIVQGQCKIRKDS